MKKIRKLTREDFRMGQSTRGVLFFDDLNADIDQYRIDDCGYIYTTCECGVCDDCKSNKEWTQGAGEIEPHAGHNLQEYIKKANDIFDDKDSDVDEEIHTFAVYDIRCDPNVELAEEIKNTLNRIAPKYYWYLTQTYNGITLYVRYK